MMDSLPPELNDNMLVLELRAQWTAGHMGRGESSWRFVMLNAGAPTQMAMLWDMWSASCKDRFRARRPTSWTLNQVIIVDKFPAENGDLWIDLNEPGLGTSEDCAPIQCGPVLTWRTDFPGRSYRGRTYWGPIQRLDLEVTFVTNALINAIEYFGEGMMSQFRWDVRSETEPHLAIISHQHNLVPEPVGRWADVQYFMPVRVMGTNRRRLHKWSL